MIYISSLFARIRALFFVRPCVKTRRFRRPMRDVHDGKCCGDIVQDSNSECLLADGDNLNRLLAMSSIPRLSSAQSSSDFGKLPLKGCCKFLCHQPLLKP